MMPDRGREERRPSAQERILAARAAAASVFVQMGYGAATMDDVARAAGMSKRTLYQLFPSKAALLEAVVEDHVAPLHIDTGLEDELDLETALVGMLGTAARHLLSPTQLGIFRLITTEVHRSPELAEAFHRAGPGRGEVAIERRLAREVGAGRLRLSSPETAGHMLFSLVIAPTQIATLLGVHGPIGRREPPDEAEIDRRVREAVSVFLRGALVSSE
jgi:AcrR family transcriptional regulator